MDRLVVMVDAGYLLRQAVEILSTKASHARVDLAITDPIVMIQALVQKGRQLLEVPNRELLRVYWYDGVQSTGHTPQQASILGTPDVAFRAGTINSRGQQKGVDSLIVTDLIELASNLAISDALLVTGDGDLAIGMQISQMKGVRIAVLGVAEFNIGVGHNQSPEITNRADRVGLWSGADLLPFMRYQPIAASTSTPVAVPAVAAAAPPATRTPLPPLTAADEARIKAEVKAYVAARPSLGVAIDPATKSIDPTTDRGLIYHIYTVLGRKLTDQEKRYIRKVFKAEFGL